MTKGGGGVHQIMMDVDDGMEQEVNYEEEKNINNVWLKGVKYNKLNILHGQDTFWS